MYFVLAIAGGILGLFVTGAAVFTVWSILDAARRNKQGEGDDRARSGAAAIAKALRRWTVMDYASLTLFLLGALLLLSDLFAVARDRASYPYYHYGYLFAAFVFMVVGMLVTVMRLAIVLRPSGSSLEDKLAEPGQADEPEEGIERRQ